MPNALVKQIAQDLWPVVRDGGDMDALTAALYRIDPEGLARMGAPKDEYKGEARDIDARRDECISEGALALVIEDVFHASFTTNGIRSKYLTPKGEA